MFNTPCIVWKTETYMWNYINIDKNQIYNYSEVVIYDTKTLDKNKQYPYLLIAGGSNDIEIPPKVSNVSDLIAGISLTSNGKSLELLSQDYYGVMNLKLSQARAGLAAVGVDKFAFFAGGYYNNNGTMECSNVIDVYYCSGVNSGTNGRINKYPTVFTLVVPAMFLSGNSFPIYEDVNEGEDTENIRKLIGYYIIFSGGMDINHNPLNSITILKLDTVNSIVTTIFNTLTLETPRYNHQSYALNSINDNNNVYFACSDGNNSDNALTNALEIFNLVNTEQKTDLYYCFRDNLIYTGYLCYHLIIENLINKYFIFENDFNQFTSSTINSINNNTILYTFIKNEKIIETPIYSDNMNKKVIEYNKINVINSQSNIQEYQNHYLYRYYTLTDNLIPEQYNFSNYKYINVYTCDYTCEYSINYIDIYYDNKIFISLNKFVFINEDISNKNYCLKLSNSDLIKDNNNTYYLWINNTYEKLNVPTDEINVNQFKVNVKNNNVKFYLNDQIFIINYYEDDTLKQLRYLNITSYIFKYYSTVIALFDYDIINRLLLNTNIITTFTLTDNTITCKNVKFINDNVLSYLRGNTIYYTNCCYY